MGIQRYSWHGLTDRKLDSIEELISVLLENRNIDPQKFFATAFERNDSRLFPDFSKSIERVSRAKANDEPVVICGDYDADGITSTAILFEAFQILGIKTEVFLPHREDDGYGLSEKTVEKVVPPAKLVIAIDNGTSAFEAIALAKKKKVDVIVIDHHHLQAGPREGGHQLREGMQLPKGALVVNPERPDNKYPFTKFCAAGLAYKFASFLLKEFGREDEAKWLLDLAALGTLADRVPLTDENRLIVIWGLRVIRDTRRPGLRSLLINSRISRDSINADTVTFRIIPKLNAAGRMSHPDIAFKLLVSKDVLEAQKIALELENLNNQRKSVTDRAVKEIHEKLTRSMPLPDIICMDGNWPAGILGILAGKISDELNRPAVAISTEKQDCVGSMRGNGTINIAETLSGLKKIFSKYGGHSEAGGFSFSLEKLSEIKSYFEKVKVPTKESLSVNYECSIFPHMINITLAEKLEQLEPHGEGNERPTILLEDLEIIEIQSMGAKKEHMRFLFSHPLAQGNLTGVFFHWGEYDLPEAGSRVDVVAEIKLDRYRSRTRVDLHLKDMKIHEEIKEKIII